MYINDSKTTKPLKGLIKMKRYALQNRHNKKFFSFVIHYDEDCINSDTAGLVLAFKPSNLKSIFGVMRKCKLNLLDYKIYKLTKEDIKRVYGE